eukprot:TRINITY_DN15553_c0_g1_i1.p1 TRINITY_DN15553_c0_g1~~TRINITY_DN15553_c0_g1_i1.p1  ORF type:complete len:293 (-),score=64.96 TRINITY_DN15553_c0_g1_i1:253-1131(-)
MLRRWYGEKSSHQQDDLEKQTKINELKSAIGPLSGHSLLFCSDECFIRYLEARNWNIQKSKRLLEETLKWRVAYKPEEIHWKDVAVEGETGKMYRANYLDKAGRPVLVLRPGRQNTTNHENQLRHLVYLLENAILNMPPGQGQMVWLIDFYGWSLSNSVPIKTARETANILQNHYPERLAMAFLYNPPKIFERFWKIVKFFLDPKTFQKVKFVYPKNDESTKIMEEYFDMHELQTTFGGENSNEYDHTEFTKLMLQDDVRTAEYWSMSDGELNGVSRNDKALETDGDVSAKP